MSEAQGSGELTIVDAIVIGSGFAGLYSIHKLRNEMGLKVQAFDNAGDVGGTWYWKRYPEKHEIWAYLRHVADKYDLRRSIMFNTQVESAEWDEDNQRWLVRANAVTYAAQFLIEAVGLLSATKVPHFPGQDSFRGE